MPITEEQKKLNIKEVQSYLRTISQINPNIPVIFPDCIYEQETINAVKAFQRDYGLPVKGEIDAETWKLIYSTYKGAEAYFAALEQITPFESHNTIIKRGDAGYSIYIIQAMLNTIAQFYDNIVSTSISGIYDEITENAFKQIQKILGIEPTGSIDYQTWNKLAKLYNAHAAMDEGTNVTDNEERKEKDKRTVQTGSVG